MAVYKINQNMVCDMVWGEGVVGWGGGVGVWGGDITYESLIKFCTTIYFVMIIFLPEPFSIVHRLGFGEQSKFSVFGGVYLKYRPNVHARFKLK